MVAITKKIELHNPYALDADGGSRVDFPKAMQPTGKKMTFECWRHGGQDFLDGNEYLNYGNYTLGAGNEFGFYLINKSSGKMQAVSASLNRVVFTAASSHYMTIPNWNPATSDFTVELLIKLPTAAAAFDGILSLGSYGETSSFSIISDTANEQLRVKIQDGSDNNAVVLVGDAAAGAQDGTYHRVSISVEYGVIMRAYLDGAASDTVSLVPIGTISNANDWTVAYDPTWGYEDIEIADIRIWSDIRTPTEISDYCWRYLAGTETGLVRYYDFSTQSGAQVTDRVSGGSNHGTLVNAPAWSNVQAILESSALELSDVEGSHHYAFTCDHDSGDIAILLDGETIASETGQASSKQCLIYPGNAFAWLNMNNHGKYSEVRYWDDVRTESEIQDNMFIELAGNEAGLVAYYKFEEKTGTTLGDDTSNNYDATITNPQWVAGFPNQGGGWEDISADVLPDYGFSHYQKTDGILDPRNRTASYGRLGFVLNNSVKNSGAKAGYYSLEHTDVRDGFVYGAGVRVTYTYSSTDRETWVGRIYEIEPDSEEKGTNTTNIVAYDWLFETTKQPARGLTVQTDKRADQGMETILGVMPLGKRPQRHDFDVGDETMKYIFDDERDERTKISGIIRRFSLTEFGRTIMDGGTLKFLNRHAPVEETTVQYDFDDAEPTVEFLRTKYSEKSVWTIVKAKSHPSEIDSANVVLATLNIAISIGAGKTEPVTLRFRDPAGAARISAKEIEDPLVASTDYVGNSSEGGGGSDLTANMTVTIVEADLSANSIKLNIYNSGSATVYTGGAAGVFQVRGLGMYRYDPAWSESVADQDLLDKHGEKELEYDLPYGDNPLTADGYSTYILDFTEEPRLDISGVVFFPEATASLASAFVDINMGERVTLARTMLGLDSDFFVVGRTVESIGRRLKVTYGVEPALSSAYCKLNDPTYAKLDEPECRAAF